MCAVSFPGAHKSHLLQLQHVTPNPLSSAGHCTTTPPHTLIVPTQESTCAVTSTSSQSPKPSDYIHHHLRWPNPLKSWRKNAHLCKCRIIFFSQVQTSTSILMSTVCIQNAYDGCIYAVSKQPNPSISPAFKLRISLSSFAQHHNFVHTLATIYASQSCARILRHNMYVSLPRALNSQNPSN